MNKDEIFINEPWLKWAIEIQAIAQTGLEFSTGKFDIQRYEQLRDISKEMISYKTGISNEKVNDLFCNERGYQTPKLGTRAAIFKDEKILLVREDNGKWSLPGGWVEVLESVKSNTVKEAKEEAGVDVIAKKVIAIQDYHKHKKINSPYGICDVFVLCDLIGGGFQENIETTESKYFGIDELPELDEIRNTREQVEMCFKAYKDPNWETVFD